LKSNFHNYCRLQLHIAIQLNTEAKFKRNTS
jgi:hypothetical protein